MRIMGIDLGYGVAKEHDILSVSILDNDRGKNEVVSITTIEVEQNDKGIGALINGVFKSSNCDYIAMNNSGSNLSLYTRLCEEIDDKNKIKAEFYNAEKSTTMIEMLSRDEVLNKVGLELKIKMYSCGYAKFSSDEYNNFALTTVYAIGVANKVLNDEVNKLNLKENR